MILHLVEDQKVINRTISLFEKVNPGNNRFLVEIPEDHHTLKYVQYSNSTVCAVYGTKTYWDIVGDVSQYEAVIFHDLTLNKCKFIYKFIQINTPFVWILWGADLYSYLAEEKGYKLYLWKPNVWNFKLRWLFRDKLSTFLRKIKKRLKNQIPSNLLYRTAYKRINYCCIFNKGDYELLIKYTDSNAKWFWFNYYPIDTILGKDLRNKRINGDNIIVGNSGSITGNHVPAFKLLKSLNTQNKKIIVPLSYGNLSYCDLLIKKGNKIIGENFLPITDFLPLHEYNNILCSASIVIMFQLRQEAVGNILISLYLGSKVYLQEENNLFKYFNSIGIKVFSVKKDLTTNNPEAFDPLPGEYQIQNRKRIFSEFNEKRIISKTKMLLEEVIKK